MAGYCKVLIGTQRQVSKGKTYLLEEVEESIPPRGIRREDFGEPVRCMHGRGRTGRGRTGCDVKCSRVCNKGEEKDSDTHERSLHTRWSFLYSYSCTGSLDNSCPTERT